MDFQAVFSGVDFTAVDADVAVFRTPQMTDETLHLGRRRLRLLIEIQLS